ncbi:MAG: DNA-binding transcriptional regulator [Planctomycetaceae bacterium]|jgi:LacI family transcriptional regulator|nr:DNA-binding transcriptional regulator [Planctomycetaceae bacterium]
MKHHFTPKPKKRILVLVETSRTFCCQIIEGVNRFALGQKEWMLVLEDRGPNDPEPSILRRTPCDGIIARTATIPMFNAIRKPTVPVIELLGDGSQPDIQNDYEAVARLASVHFQERGLSHFAYFSAGHCWWSRELSEAFRQQCQQNGTECRICPTESSANSVSLPVNVDIRSEKQIGQWLKSLPKPIGILCPEDGHAICLLNICRSKGISVPFEAAVLGLGNNDTLCNATTPRLSSVAIDGHRIGYRAAELLHKKMNGLFVSGTPQKIPPLYISTRHSTDFVAVDHEDIRNALQYVSDHLADRFTLEHLARHIGISKRSLIRRFQDFLGHPPEKEIHMIRMNRAKELLVETDLSVAQIGRNVGYGTSEYFIRIFHRQFGVTPNLFRKSSKQ